MNNYDKLVDYFNKKGNTRVEFIKELDNDWFKSKTGEAMPFWVPEFATKSIFNELQRGVFIDFNNVRLGGHSFWQDRWLVQDILENGIINPAQMVVSKNRQMNSITSVYKNQEYFHHLHPGIGSQMAAKIAGIDKVPAFIFSDNDHPFNSDAIEINSADQVIDCLRPYSLETFQVETYYGGCNIPEDPSKIYRFALQPRFEKVGTDWESKAWVWDPPPNYAKIFYNSIPLSIYVGTDNEKVSDHFKNRILNKYILEIIGKEVTNIIIRDDVKSNTNLTSDGLPKTFDINFIPIKVEDRYKVPKLSKFTGMSIYINEDFKYNSHIIDLFWFGNSNKALFKCSENVILFNCEHLSWKYTDNPINEHIGLLSRSYE